VAWSGLSTGTTDPRMPIGETATSRSCGLRPIGQQILELNRSRMPNRFLGSSSRYGTVGDNWSCRMIETSELADDFTSGCLDEVFVGSLRARPTTAPRRKQHAAAEVLTLSLTRRFTINCDRVTQRPWDAGRSGLGKDYSFRRARIGSIRAAPSAGSQAATRAAAPSVAATKEKVIGS
jgi:hypothetical protein